MIGPNSEYMQGYKAGLHQAQAELASYKAGVEVEATVNKYGELHFSKDLPHLANQRVRVLVRAIDPIAGKEDGV